jgi:hypothetical protein
MSTPAPTKFTLRFHDRSNHEMLGLLAEHYGVTKNQLAEEMLERELRAAVLLLEQDLTGTLALLRKYRRQDHLSGAIEEFAQAEAYGQDPIQTRMVQTPRAHDVYGVAEAFT